MMRKRGRENPCYICGHYHNFEGGEVCGVCGHKKSDAGDGGGQLIGGHLSAFPSEIIPGFLYLGSYDNASRSELLKAQGISHILNAVPTCPNLYKNSFTYFSMPESTGIPYDSCFDFLEQARNGGAHVLVHCMSGQSRSPSIVAAYFMRRDGMSLEDAVTSLKQVHPSTNISQAITEQLIQYEASLRERRQAGQALSSELQQEQHLEQQQQQHQQEAQDQQPGFLQFDMSATRPGQTSTPGPLTFLGGAENAQSHAHGSSQGGAPSHSNAAPAFSFQMPSFPVPPDGFVFGASNAPPQGSGQ